MSETSIAVQRPMELMAQAVLSGDVKIEVVRELAQMHREEREHQSMVDFNEAMHRAQSKMRRIGVDAENPQTRSKYATYAKLDKVLRPIYSEEGFSLSFNTEDCPIPEHVRVSCDVSRGGHVKHYQSDIPSDGKGPKGNDVMSKTHAVGSAMSYGCRYLLKMIFNVAVGETDDDGNEGMDEGDRQGFIDSIQTASNMDELKKRYQAAAKLAVEAKDPKSMRILTDFKDARKKELANA